MTIESIIRRTEVEKRTGLSRSSIYAAIGNGSFPKPIRLTPKTVGWVESEIDAWRLARIAERDRTKNRL